MCIVSFNRKTYCYPHFIDVKAEAWRCYLYWAFGPDAEGERWQQVPGLQECMDG